MAFWVQKLHVNFNRRVGVTDMHPLAKTEKNATGLKPDITFVLLVSDEALLPLKGCVNNQDFRK
jgi:hypothetical protein